MMGSRRTGFLTTALVAGGLLGLAAPLHAAVGDTTRVSVDSAGTQATGGSSIVPSISADGRYVAFQSAATNLVAGDSNGGADVFVHDRTTGATTRVSVDSAGTQATGGFSFEPSISADGRYVAFRSEATNLVAGDSNSDADVFVHDRTTGATTRVSVDSAGTQATGGNSLAPSISAEGRYVAFWSGATNLVAGDSNALPDVFVHDRTTGATTRVSVDSAGTQATGGSSFEPSISADGRYVAFQSAATNLVAGDSNGETDVFVHDRTTGATTRVSVDSAGTQADDDSSIEPSISADGRYVAFRTTAENLVAGDSNSASDVFVHDRTTGATTRVSVDSAGTQASSDSLDPSISADGRYIAFRSDAGNLVAGDSNGSTDVFVHDRTTGATTRVSVDSAGTQANGGSVEAPSISADGRYVAFESDATNLVAGDSNGFPDVFVHEFLAAPSPPGGTTYFPLTVARAGTGTGHVGGDPHLQIDCGSNCSSLLAASTFGVLVPTADAGSVFSGWSGDCLYVEADGCRVHMTSSKTVTAAFELADPEPSPSPDPSPEPEPSPDPSPDPEPESFDVSISLDLVKRHGKLVARGNVSSAEPSCIQGVTVDIVRIRNQQTIPKGSDVTNANGRYRVLLGTKKGTYMATVAAHSPSELIDCLGAESGRANKT